MALLGCRVAQGRVLVQPELDSFGSLSGVCLILVMVLQASPLMMGLGLAEEVCGCHVVAQFLQFG